MNNVKITHSLGFCGGKWQGQKEVTNISPAASIIKAKTLSQTDNPKRTYKIREL